MHLNDLLVLDIFKREVLCDGVIYDMFRKNNRCLWSCNGGILFLWYFNIV